MRKIPVFCLALWSLALAVSPALAAEPARPNIVFILADDLGYGDVKCLNPQGKIPTPNMDKLAAGGMIFTDAHSSSSVCTPTRYGILTGRYNWRSSLKNGVLGGYSPRLIEPGRRDSARDGAFGVERTLAELYEMACTNPSPINQHLPRLCALARECAHVTELGTGRGLATTALLYGQPDRLVCCDQVRHPQVDMLARLAGRTEFVFQQVDVLHGEIEETDLLVIDTRHDYEHLREELRRHAGKVRCYLVLPGTSTHSHDGETEGSRGLWPAVEEFLAEGTFRLRERRHDHGGLTILEAARRPARTGDGAPGLSSQQARVSNQMQ